ncbi:HAMP domain-containing histidine kinase [Pseudonocardia sp. DSM 110487]|uniref:sensor histidine kinase n=1 Tax=Pseudonocardia sp. DSM 110487 TaxID=2865833 RepID=UPI001C69F88F|nr:HAMP domain-containing sensor histidine kinase [Pseudonocardia sp. DSM 110487]QYN38007.1 HAMP domain-containing histidine kinase [Pseudonocardia sp. DSM 110487]
MTVLYAAVFFVAGAVLVALMMLYLAHALDGQMAARIGAAEQAVELPPPVQQELRVQFQRDRDHVLAAMLTASLASLGAIGVIAAALGWLVADRALRPLQQISATARRTADRNLHERIALTGRDDEIKDLADAIDAMLDRLDRSFDSQRRFVANASHELRTPLTLNRTLIEVTLDDPHTSEAVRQLGTTLLAVNDRHEHLIDGLLTLASSEQRIAQPAPVDLAEIARHLTRERQADADRAGIDISTDLRPAPVTGDPVLLERLAHNLIDNAIRYNRRSHGVITIATGTVDGRARLTVGNTGPAVPSYEIPTLFRPFRRLPTTERLAEPVGSRHRGAGLGLSIVAAVAHAHGGDAHAQPGDDGGLTIRVEIPTAPDPLAAH